MKRLLDAFVGWLMRLYRRSPLYPAWGRRLATVLARLPTSRTPVVKDIDGIRYELDLSEVIDSSLYYSGTFEEATEKAIVAALLPGMYALDLGANVGYHTFRIARAVGPTGRVIAVEPMPRARAKLLRNLALNDFDNVEVVDVALSDSEQGRQQVAFENSYRLDGRQSTDTAEVRMTSVDVLVDEMKLDRVDFIKLDVDGYEGKVLRGAVETLTRWHPKIVFEISPGAMAAIGDDAAKLVDLLDGLGYGLQTENGEPIDDVEGLLRSVGDYSINLLALRQA